MSIKIPLIDCSAISVGSFEEVSDESYIKVGEAIGAAMTGIGMCNFINHGVDMKKVQKVYKVSKEFFELSHEKKSKYTKKALKTFYMGYSGPGEELLNEEEENSIELREFWDVIGFDAYDETKYPNEEVPDFKPAFDDIRNEMENFAKKVLRCIENFFKLEDGFLINRHHNLGDHSIQTHTDLRSIYYYLLNPEENIPPNAIRCGEHCDWETFALLIQDMVGGLEVKTLAGEWIEATPVKDAILINSGELLEYWTGGRFHAAMHRVRILTEEGKAPKDPRQSLIYFVSPDGPVKVEPLFSVLPEKEAQFAKYDGALIAYDHVTKHMEDTSSYLKSKKL